MSQVEVAEVSLPQKYINLTKEILEKNPHPALRSLLAKQVVENKLNSDTVTKVTPEYAGDDGSGLLNGDGVFLADMRKLNEFDETQSSKIVTLFRQTYESDFFRVKHASKEYSRIVFIKVIKVGKEAFFANERLDAFVFYAYHPDGEFIGKNCSREIQPDTAHQSAITVPSPCMYNLPLLVLDSHFVQLYKMDIPETLSSEVDSGPSAGLDIGSSASSIADVGSGPSVGSGAGSGANGGGKLRSAKKTSKRRSVKSKPRYYRRSVGSINHRRKKTTRRRK